MPTDQEELFELLDALCNGTMTPGERERLGERLAADPAARRLYFDYLDLHCLLRQWRQTAAGRKTVEFKGQGAGDAAALPASYVFHPTFSNPENPAPPSDPSRLHRLPLSSRHAPFLSLENPVGYYGFCYGVSGIALCVLLLIFSLMHSPAYRGDESATGYAGAGNSDAPREFVPRTPAGPRTPEPKIPEIAQITGMVDCEFLDNLAPMHHRIGIGHNNKFALKKGLMEITYFSGARVILQGPCTYEIDSASGGFLSIGKLTARVETAKPQAANQKSEIINHKSSNPQSPIPNPLFAVRTPIAIVTDLGTEFGVEVSESGETRAHVFVGAVRFVSNAKSGTDEGRLLEAGQAAKVAAEGDVEIFSPEAKPTAFARAMPAPAPKPKTSGLVVLAHFRMGEDDGGAADGLTAKNTRDSVYAWTLERHGSPRYTADAAAPGSALAMLFHGDGDQGDHFFGNNVATAEIDNFGIEAWVKPAGNTSTGAIVWNGDAGWGLLQRGNILCGHWNNLGDLGAFRFTPGQWHHIAMVCNAGKAEFYADGNVEGGEFHNGGVPVTQTLMPPAVPFGRFWIGCHRHTPGGQERFLHFDGAIDEVRVFTFAPGTFRSEYLLNK